MFGDYTIQQAAEVLDTCDEVVIETIARGGLPTYRQFLLFGPIRIKKAFIDDIAPELRARHQRTNTTRADWERRRQEAMQQDIELEQMKEDAKRSEEEFRKEQEDFFKQFSSLMEEKRRRMLDKIKKQEDNSEK